MKLINYLIFSAIIFICGCTIGPAGKWSVGYNVSGAKVPAGCFTASVQYFQNRASIVQPQLAQMLTEKLKDKILSQTKLKILSGAAIGDANFEGVITSYLTEPKQVSGGDQITATLNRLEIKIKVKYTNFKDSEFEFDSDFSRYIEYPASQTLEQVERDKLEDMVNLLVEDIFNRAFVNW